MALANASRCLVMLLKLKTPPGRAAPQNTAKHQVLLPALPAQVSRQGPSELCNAPPPRHVSWGRLSAGGTGGPLGVS